MTGAGGFIGGVLVTQLAASGATVVAYDQFPHGVPEPWANTPGVIVAQGDICDPRGLGAAMEDCDWVFHQASLKVPACADDPGRAVDVLVKGTHCVAMAAVQLGVQLGAEVTAVASTPEKLGVASENGASRLINHRTQNLRQALKEALAGVRQVPDVELHHLAHHQPEVAAGQRVVADVGDAVRRQHGPGQGQEPVAHGRRHPGVEAVGDDVVERLPFGRELHQVGVVQREVL